MLLIVHLLSFIWVMCPAHFHFILVLHWTMSVTLVLWIMMMLRILSFSVTFSIFLSMALWLASSFFTNAFVRYHVWHPYVISGKTHWLKTFFLDSWEGACPQRFPSCFYSYRNFLCCSDFHIYCLSQIFVASYLLYFCTIYLHFCCCEYLS